MQHIRGPLRPQLKKLDLRRFPVSNIKATSKGKVLNMKVVGNVLLVLIDI
jgi:hypothetical protein